MSLHPSHTVQRVTMIGRAEVTGLTPSSAIKIPLFDGHELLFSTMESAQLARQPRAKKSSLAKLTIEQSSQIVERHYSGQSLRELAADFGVSHETIRTTIKQYQAQLSQEKSNPEEENFMLDSS